MRPRPLTYMLFALIGYLPLILAGAALLTGLLLGAFLPIQNPEAPVPLVENGLWSAAALIIFLLVSYGAYRLFERSTKPMFKLWSLYGSWLILGFGAVYVFLGTLAGASMAIVDEVVSPAALQLSQLQSSLSALLALQVCIVPWSIAATFALAAVFRKINSNQNSGAL